MRTSVFNMIDKKIVENFAEGHDIKFIKNYLIDKMNRFRDNIHRADSKVDILKLLTMETETIYPTRTKYQVIYIKVCEQRLKDLDWLIMNKYRFPGKSNSQVFKLIKLKEKLSEENALPF